MGDSRRLDINSAMLRQALRAYEMDTVREVGRAGPMGAWGLGYRQSLKTRRRCASETEIGSSAQTGAK